MSRPANSWMEVLSLSFHLLYMSLCSVICRSSNFEAQSTIEQSNCACTTCTLQRRQRNVSDAKQKTVVKGRSSWTYSWAASETYSSLRQKMRFCGSRAEVLPLKILICMERLDSVTLYHLYLKKGTSQKGDMLKLRPKLQMWSKLLRDHRGFVQITWEEGGRLTRGTWRYMKQTMIPTLDGFCDSPAVRKRALKNLILASSTCTPLFAFTIPQCDSLYWPASNCWYK